MKKSNDNNQSSLFLDAVKDVVPLVSKNVAEYKPKPTQLIRQKQLDDAKINSDAMDDDYNRNIATGSELIYAAANTNTRILKKLKRGHYKVERYLDLHGMNKIEAKAAISKFYTQVIADDIRVIAIVHGKGNSSSNKPVLKPMVANWLATHSKVLAFCSAPAAQGGTGCTLVLLRKNKG